MRMGTQQQQALGQTLCLKDSKYRENTTVMCLSIGTPKNNKISICPKWKIKDGLSYLFHSFKNKYFNKIPLGNMLHFQNKL